MTASRTKWILSGLIALLAVFQASRASAGFIPVRDASVLLAGGSKLAFSVGLLDADGASLGGGASEDSPALAPLGHSDKSDDRRVFEERLGRACENPASQDAGSTPQSNGSGPISAAALSSTAQVPRTTLITRLPNEMGIDFSTPPPWAPLRPPRPHTCEN